MLRTYRIKKQDHSAKNKRGDAAEKQEELVKDKEDSVDKNPETVKCMISEEGDSDVQTLTAQYKHPRPFIRKNVQPVRVQGAMNVYRRPHFHPHSRMNLQALHGFRSFAERESISTEQGITLQGHSLSSAGYGETKTRNQGKSICQESRNEESAGGSSLVEAKNEPKVQLQEGTEPHVMTEHFRATNTLPSSSHVLVSNTDSHGFRKMSRTSRSHSVSSRSQTCVDSKSLTQSKSLPDMKLKSSFKEFTPDISVDGDDETYRLQCSCPGLYQCSVTGLVFHMEGEGDVVYRTVPWNRKLLGQHHKKPAGPLFDITCVQQSVCQLHLPHCEICSTGGCHFLSVAHVSDEGIQFISPQKITETHVVINITEFSGFGNVKDEDSPPDPVRALVLLFYRPPQGPDPESIINVLLLPKNVSMRNVLQTRMKLVEDEKYIDTSPHCNMCPDHLYKLSTGPEDGSILVQPTEAEFDCENYDNYFPSFQVILGNITKHIKLILSQANSSLSVWERRICLSSTGERKSCSLNNVNLPPKQRLLDVRSSFIDGVSGPVLKTLLDRLLEKRVISDSERESVDEMENKRDKARFVFDTVRKKGDAASSEMIDFLCELDPFLSEHLGLI